MSDELFSTWNEIKAGLGLFFKTILYTFLGFIFIAGAAYVWYLCRQ